mmetsp:Transcript_19112/g.52437  ORF Transcript_19112/g.52437 Transcript_19112/m.52437 type:complete len:223 (-) Transcript_19112:1868-2536(-)
MPATTRVEAKKGEMEGMATPWTIRFHPPYPRRRPAPPGQLRSLFLHRPQCRTFVPKMEPAKLRRPRWDPNRPPLLPKQGTVWWNTIPITMNSNAVPAQVLPQNPVRRVSLDLPSPLQIATLSLAIATRVNKELVEVPPLSEVNWWNAGVHWIAPAPPFPISNQLPRTTMALSIATLIKPAPKPRFNGGPRQFQAESALFRRISLGQNSLRSIAMLPWPVARP